MVKISLFLSLFFRKGWHDQMCLAAMFHICLAVLFRFKGLKPTAALLSRGISDAESGRRTGQGWQGKKRLRSVVWARTKPPPSEWVRLYVSVIKFFTRRWTKFCLYVQNSGPTNNNDLCSELSGLACMICLCVFVLCKQICYLFAQTTVFRSWCI